MRAGFGKCDITPALGTELAGFGYYLGRTAQSVIDPLYARAVMLEHRNETTLIISCDLLGLSKAVCDEVRAYAATLGCENVMIVSVHTHCGPAIKYHEGCGYVCDKYVEKLPALICSAVKEAFDDMCDVTSLTHTCAPAESDHIYNRAAKNGPVDRNIRGFIIHRAAKKPIAMVSGACHGVFRGRIPAVSADFSGEINRILDADGYLGIYINGLCGDIDPYMPDDARLCEYARLAADVFRANQVSLPIALENGIAKFSLKLTPVTRADIIDAAAQAVERAGGEEVPQAKVALRWKEEMLEKVDYLESSEDIEIRYMLLGGVPIMALPFEGFTQIGVDIRGICRREDALILGCADELLGYLPTKDDIDRGAYAALESTFLYKRLPVVPGEAERLGLEMGNALAAALKNRKPIFYCQLDYEHIPYPSPVSGKGTIANNGCGPCAASMVAENMLGVAFPPEEASKFGLECGARAAVGTNFYIYAKAFAEKFGLIVHDTEDADEALRFLQEKRGMIIANTFGDRPDDGYIGVFSDSGHYIVLAAAEGNEVKVWDSMYRPGRFDIPGRAGKVRMDGFDAYADFSIIRNDCVNRPFFLFEKT